jgi:hypothetical protein
MHLCRLISSSGGWTLATLLQTLEDYLPVLLGLVKDGKVCFSPLVFSTWRMHALCYFLSVRIELSTSRFTCTCYTPTTWCIDYYYIYGVGSHLQYKVQFVWMNQEDDKEVVIFLISYIFLDLFAEECWSICSGYFCALFTGNDNV